MIIEVPTLYSAEIVPRRARIARKVDIIVNEAVEIRRVRETDLAPVFRASLDKDSRFGTLFDIEYRSLDGDLYWPVTPAIHRGGPAALAAMRGWKPQDVMDHWSIANRACREQPHEFFGMLPWEPGRWSKHPKVEWIGQEAAERISRDWISDDRAERAARLREAYRESCVDVDGAIWTRCSGPCWIMGYGPQPRSLAIEVFADRAAAKEIHGDFRSCYIIRPGESVSPDLLDLMGAHGVCAVDVAGHLEVGDIGFAMERLRDETDPINRMTMVWQEFGISDLSRRLRLPQWAKDIATGRELTVPDREVDGNIHQVCDYMNSEISADADLAEIASEVNGMVFRASGLDHERGGIAPK